MTHSKLLLPPAAIITSQLWDGLPAAASRHPLRESRWSHKIKSPTRRAKSHSPSRRSPKLRHTNGRLDEDPVTASVPRTNDADMHQQTLARLRPIAVIPTREKKERGMSESEIPKRGGVIRRSVTGASQAQTQQMERRAPADPSMSPTRRLMAHFRDEAFRERSAENTRRMIVIARSPTAGDSNAAAACISTNQQKLALKALKYRKLLARASEIDVARLQDPTFDVLEGLGVQWSKP